MSEQEDDLLNSILDLEGTFYNEGYESGVADGKRAGLIEGRAFGLEKGFQKHLAMGQLYGRAVVWSGRLPPSQVEDQVENDHQKNTKVLDGQLKSESQSGTTGESILHPPDCPSELDLLPILPNNSRLEKHIRTLYALAEISSISIQNTEDAVADFDDRLRRAEGKMKIIQKLTRETSLSEVTNMVSPTIKSRKMSQTGSIEDASSLRTKS